MHRMDHVFQSKAVAHTCRVVIPPSLTNSYWIKLGECCQTPRKMQFLAGLPESLTCKRSLVHIQLRPLSCNCRSHKELCRRQLTGFEVTKSSSSLNPESSFRPCLVAPCPGNSAIRVRNGMSVRHRRKFERGPNMFDLSDRCRQMVLVSVAMRIQSWEDNLRSHRPLRHPSVC